MKLQDSGPSGPKSLQSQNRPRPENRLSISRLDVVHAQRRRNQTRSFADKQVVYRVEIKPLLVATIHRLPQRTTESIFPTPGTVSPRVAFQTPLGPSRTAVPPLTSRIVQPSMVVGFVSGTGVGLAETFVRSPVGRGALVFCFVGNETKCVVGATFLNASCARAIAVAVGVGLVGKLRSSSRSDLAGSGG
jgi:hypothetical protein